MDSCLRRDSPDARPTPASHILFLGVSALLFAVSVAVTVNRSIAMSTMDLMPMPGGWTMSMVWMRMPGQTWPEAILSFLGMWILMMIAMMLPSLVATLWRFRQGFHHAGNMPVGRLTLLVGLGYFCVWSLFGLIVFPLGVALSYLVMQVPTLATGVPFGIGGVVLIAGAIQFSRWKAHYLAGCRTAPGLCLPVPTNSVSAWRQGLRLGLHCCLCCVNLTMILLVSGMMDLYAMALVTAAITIERLTPAAELTKRLIGAVAIGVGIFMIGRAVGLWT